LDQEFFLFLFRERIILKILFFLDRFFVDFKKTDSCSEDFFLQIIFINSEATEVTSQSSNLVIIGENFQF